MNRVPFRASAGHRFAFGVAVLLATGGCGIFGGSGKDPRGVLAADADVRRDAVVALGATRDPAAVPVLTDRLLKDPDNLVRIGENVTGKVICALGDTVGMVAMAMIKKYRADFEKRLGKVAAGAAHG